MSDDQDNADKPYEATRRKLEDARKKGEIVRSQDTVTLVFLAGFLVSLYILFDHVMWPLVLDIKKYVAAQSQRPLSASFDNDLDQAVRWMMQVALVVFLIPFALVLTALIAAKQIIFTGDKLKPKLNRISLVANFKKKFGASGVVEFLKSAAKLFVFSTILFLWLRDTQTPFASTVLFEEAAALIKIRNLALSWLWYLLGTYVVFACIDLLWQTREHAQKNRMSHKEMKDEHKNEEGDETTRQQRRAKAEEIATNRMLLDVPKAAVVIVNPTHYAVALKWTGGKKEVPKCVAKGVDETARKIREIAAQSGVPLYQDPATARLLHATIKIGETINHDHYKAVAVAMGYAQRIRKMARS